MNYAGIGSRRISKEEENNICWIAGKLAEKDHIVYSGNAEGADIAFQKGSGGKCVLLLPWMNFNKDKFSGPCLAKYDVGKSEAGHESIAKFHPAPYSLSHGGKLMMARNYHQIYGFKEFSPVSFVICCADSQNGAILGGTGQACRIAAAENIPVFNIRYISPEDILKELQQIFPSL